MSYFTTGGPGKEHGTNKPPPTRWVWESTKGDTMCLTPLRILSVVTHLGWARHTPPGKTLSQSDLPKTTQKLIPSPYCRLQAMWPRSSPGFPDPPALHPGSPFPIKSLAFSARVSPWPIHFWVLDKSLLSGPGRGPPSSNTLTAHPVLAFCWPPWVTSVLCRPTSPRFLWELCLPAPPHGSRAELTHRGACMRLGKSIGSGSFLFSKGYHCHMQWWMVTRTPHGFRHILILLCFAFSSSSHLTPCWPTVALAPPFCHQLTCWFTEAGAARRQPKQISQAPSQHHVSNWTFLTPQINWSVIPLVFSSPAPSTTMEGLISTIRPSCSTTHGGSAPMSIPDWHTSILAVGTSTRDFPGGPVVKNPPSSVGDAGWILGQGIQIPRAAGSECSGAQKMCLNPWGVLVTIHHCMWQWYPLENRKLPLPMLFPSLPAAVKDCAATTTWHSQMNK